MKNLLTNVLLLFSLILFSCGDEIDEETTIADTESHDVEASSESCLYKLAGRSAAVYWTAYKHTGKIAVNGRMDSVVIFDAFTGASPMNVFASAQIKVHTASVNSKDPVRDKKLKEIYFGSMANTEIIEGNLISWEGSDTEGTCQLALIMNGVGQEVSGAYTVEENIVQLKFTIEPNNWGAEEAIVKLGEECAEKHTGEDGKTVFWPDVDILVEVVLEKECP